jgi:gas vesicle protein
MANHDTTGSGALLVAFIAGAVAGAAVALLFAPTTGAETREYLGERFREGRDKATAAAREGHDAFNRERQNFGQAFQRAREKYQAGHTPDDQEV